MHFKNIKCILFDLDGVLVDGHPLQLKSTLDSLKKYINCTKEVKSLVNETIPTKEKLKILKSRGLIKKSDINKIYNNKRKLFDKIAQKKIKFNKKINNVFKKLKEKNLKVAVVTNSNKSSAIKILKKLQIINLLDLLVTNANRIKPKPNPEPYNYAIKKLKVEKKNSLIFEDSPVGILSAKRSGANYFLIKNPNQINLKFLNKILKIKL